MENPKCNKLLNLKMGNVTTDKAVSTFLPEDVVDLFPHAVNGYRPEKELIKIYVKAYVTEHNLDTFMAATSCVLVNNVLSKGEKESRLEICRCFRDGNEEKVKEKIRSDISRVYSKVPKRNADELLNTHFERAKRCYEAGRDPFGEEFANKDIESLLAEVFA